MSDKDFITKYLKDFSSLVSPNDEIIEKITLIKNILLEVKKNNSKVMIFGNGGSAAIASHVSVDLTKNAKIRSANYNEADLITCFSNDYGYENWISEAIKSYHQTSDLVVLISVSGESKNVVNAAKTAKDLGLKVITFTGRDKDNSLKLIGDINFWVDSHAYNVVECIHMIWLTTAIDAIIGKSVYEVS